MAISAGIWLHLRMNGSSISRVITDQLGAMQQRKPGTSAHQKHAEYLSSWSRFTLWFVASVATFVSLIAVLALATRGLSILEGLGLFLSSFALLLEMAIGLQRKNQRQNSALANTSTSDSSSAPQPAFDADKRSLLARLTLNGSAHENGIAGAA